MSESGQSRFVFGEEGPGADTQAEVLRGEVLEAPRGAQNIDAVEQRGSRFSIRKRALAAGAAVAILVGGAILSSGGGESEPVGGQGVALAADPAKDNCDVNLQLSANRAEKVHASRVGVMSSLFEENNKLVELVEKDDAVETLRTQVAKDGRVAAIMLEVLSLRDGQNSPDTLTAEGLRKSYDNLMSHPNSENSDRRVSYVCEQLAFVEARDGSTTEKTFAVVGGNAGAIQLDHSKEGADSIKIVPVTKDRTIKGYVIGANLDRPNLSQDAAAFLAQFKNDLIIDADTGEIVIRNLKAPESKRRDNAAQGGAQTNENKQTGGVRPNRAQRRAAARRQRQATGRKPVRPSTGRKLTRPGSGSGSGGRPGGGGPGCQGTGRGCPGEGPGPGGPGGPSAPAPERAPAPAPERPAPTTTPPAPKPPAPQPPAPQPPAEQPPAEQPLPPKDEPTPPADAPK